MYNTIENLHIELTDLCNARCPQCIRTDPRTGEPQPWLIKTQLYENDFKKIVSPDDIKNINYVNFCGNYGEPLAARDLIPITKYLYEHNPKMHIDVATNGSVRSEDWWWDLLKVIQGKSFKVIFGLDGINQEQHSLYRQNTSFDRILENAEFFIDNGGIADWQYLIFKHNENDVETARQMAKEKGFNHFSPVATERFWSGDTFKYMFKDKEYTLERSSVAPNKKQLMNIKNYSHKKEIKCFAKARQEAYIDCMGYITPCCYLGMYLYAAKADLPITFHMQTEMMSMFKDMDIERLKGSLSKVIKDPWFFELTLMHSELKPERCYKVCGSEINRKEYVE